MDVRRFVAAGRGRGPEGQGQAVLEAGVVHPAMQAGLACHPLQRRQRQFIEQRLRRRHELEFDAQVRESVAQVAARGLDGVQQVAGQRAALGKELDAAIQVVAIAVAARKAQRELFETVAAQHVDQVAAGASGLQQQAYKAVLGANTRDPRAHACIRQALPEEGKRHSRV